MIDKAFLKRIQERTLDVLKYSKEEEQHGLELHKKSIVFDSLCEPPRPLSKELLAKINELLDEGVDRRSIGPRTAKIRQAMVKNTDYVAEYAEAWEHSGVTCISSTMGTTDLMATINRMADSEYVIDTLSNVLVKTNCVDDIRKAKENGKHTIMWNIQNSLPFGGGVDAAKELDNIDLLYKLGLRVVQLTYNLRNFVGDGCTERYQSGLSYFGLKVIERMNKLGMLVDTSHCGTETTLDAIEISKDPVAATHTGCKGYYFHTRAKTDEELQAIAEKGGFVGIYLEQGFLGGKGTLKEALDQIDYAVNLIGVEHVGIGTDLSYSPTFPRMKQMAKEEAEKMKSIPLLSPDTKRFWLGWHPEKPTYHYGLTEEMVEDERNEGSLAWINWPYYTVGLVTRGYSDQEIQKIIGGNFLRIIEKVVG